PRSGTSEHSFLRWPNELPGTGSADSATGSDHWYVHSGPGREVFARSPGRVLGTHRSPLRNSWRESMIELGVILLVVGFITGISILWTIGIVLLVIGAVLAILGGTGRRVGGRAHWY